MDNLIEALTIFKTYIGNKERPTNAWNSHLYVTCPPSEVSAEDMTRLAELSFYPHDKTSFVSDVFGAE